MEQRKSMSGAENSDQRMDTGCTVEHTEQPAPHKELSFEQMYQHYRPLLCAFLTRRTDNAELAEDIAQETFLKVWLAWSRKKLPPHFEAWLYHVARNGNIDAYRQRTRNGKIRLQALDTIEDMYDEAASLQQVGIEERELVHATLEQMDDMARLVLQLCLHEGRSYRDVSSLLKMSYSTVRSRLYRARKTFRTLYDAQAYETG